MGRQREEHLRNELRPFVERRNFVGYSAVILDFSIFFSATALACIADQLWLKGLLSVIAGTMIATLFVLGHDATHGSLVSSPRQNRVLGSLLMMPALHNYALWRLQHNRGHHQSTNVKGLNSWSPLTVSEFNSLSMWEQWRERIYRGGGFGLYYLIERWWKHKFYPRKGIGGELRARALADFALIVGWFLLLSCGVLLIGDLYDKPWWDSLLWGFVVPYFVWNCSMGLTVYLQHTHPLVPWFLSQSEAQRYGSQEELTVNVKYPRWYGILSHEIMEHTAHHINPLIPFYRLRAAQEHLNVVLGDDAIVEQMGLRYLLVLMRKCKLYDYDLQEWTDFSGRTTGQTQAPWMSQQTPHA